MMPAVASAPARSTTTFAPWRAKAADVARPIPLPPPVTSATLPAKSISLPSAQRSAQLGTGTKPRVSLPALEAEALIIVRRNLVTDFSVLIQSGDIRHEHARLSWYVCADIPG